jgi:ubiquinone/menaquinone biosynthesis C-methylase UbiE
MCRYVIGNPDIINFSKNTKNKFALDMKSKTISIWEQTINNPPLGYKEYFEAESNFLKKNLALNHTALDIGCGNGRSIEHMAPLVKNIIGIDNDNEAAIEAKEKLKTTSNVKIFFEDAEKTHFEDNYFDVVFMGLTFVNLGETKHNVLSEIRRILKKDGKFIFSVFSEDALETRLSTYQEYEGGYTIIDERKGTVRFNKDGATSEQFSKSEIETILNDSGFKIDEIIKGKIYYLISATKN